MGNQVLQVRQIIQVHPVIREHRVLRQYRAFQVLLEWQVLNIPPNLKAENDREILSANLIASMGRSRMAD